jgi:hypothetical protein
MHIYPFSFILFKTQQDIIYEEGIKTFFEVENLGPTNKDICIRFLD